MKCYILQVFLTSSQCETTYLYIIGPSTGCIHSSFCWLVCVKLLLLTSKCKMIVDCSMAAKNQQGHPKTYFPHQKQNYLLEIWHFLNMTLGANESLCSYCHLCSQGRPHRNIHQLQCSIILSCLVRRMVCQCLCQT